METLESTFLFLDYLTDTKRKRHMVGGILMSVSPFLWRIGVYHDDDQRRHRQ